MGAVNSAAAAAADDDDDKDDAEIQVWINCAKMMTTDRAILRV